MNWLIVILLLVVIFQLEEIIDQVAPEKPSLAAWVKGKWNGQS